MELPLDYQGVQFLLALALGLGNGLHYDLLRGLRRTFPRLTHPADLWFLLTYLAGNLLFALFVGNGELRIFMFFAIVLGFILWMLLFSRYLLKVSTIFWNVLTAPLRYFCRFLKKIIKKLKKILKNIFSSAKKSVTIRCAQRNLPREKTSGGNSDAAL